MAPPPSRPISQVSMDDYNDDKNAMALTSTRATASTTTFCAVLDLPLHSQLSLDGHSIVLQRDDFIGIVGIPCAADEALHFLTIRPASRPKGKGSRPQYAAVTTGVWLPSSGAAAAWIRRYDPLTEEVADQAVDDVTCRNLAAQMASQLHAMDPHRVLQYTSVVRTPVAWKNLTNCIRPAHWTRRGLTPGAKIVPSGLSGEHPEDAPSSIRDGCSPQYPPIPVVDKSSAQRQTTHAGTRAYLQNLSPAQRTALWLEPNVGTSLLRQVLVTVYDQDWSALLGDLQLAYVLFLHLHCYASLAHWRDLVALVSLVDNTLVGSGDDEPAAANFYQALVPLLQAQIATLEVDFFDDLDLSEDNFLGPALRRIVTLLQDSGIAKLRKASHDLQALLRNRFPRQFSPTTPTTEVVETGASVGDRMQVEEEESDDDDDSEGPVVVGLDDLAAAGQRNAAWEQAAVQQRARCGVTNDDKVSLYRSRYPILFAAVQPHEDVLMTCARALEAAADVSLVREAAAYLEQVEGGTRSEHA
jgi:hypothetical protein